MQAQFKRLIRTYVPATAIHALKRIWAQLNTRAAQRAFENAPVLPQYLPPEMLPKLAERFPRAPPYGYDPATLDQRGAERVRRMKPFLPKGPLRSLEIGAHDGMVSYHLARFGADASVIDFNQSNLDSRAKGAGVKFIAGNAESLPVADGALDLVCSFNAFEHFEKPDKILREVLRVVRPGGVLYFRFGPLYRASYGLHAMHAISVPFVQYLFERPVLDEYVKQIGKRRIEYEALNEWTVAQFRSLWDSVADAAEVMIYREVADLNGLSLIVEFPSCFRKAGKFEDLMLSEIEVCFRRK